MLTIADCRRRVRLEFFLGTKRARRESLKKIDLLIKQLEGFRTALRTEADLITQYEAKQKSNPSKLKKGKVAVANKRQKPKYLPGKLFAVRERLGASQPKWRD